MSWERVFTAMYKTKGRKKVSFHALQEGNLHSGDLPLKHTTGVRKIINRLFLTIL